MIAGARHTGPRAANLDLRHAAEEVGDQGPVERAPKQVRAHTRVRLDCHGVVRVELPAR
jgi:hypothetical protein